jgi:uncharacterized membrane protein YuzA (DUF378 family)
MTSQDVAQTSGIASAPALTIADWAAFSLVVMGGLNWALIGAFSFNPVANLLGDHSLSARIAYLVFGLASLYALYTATKLVQPL